MAMTVPMSYTDRRSPVITILDFDGDRLRARLRVEGGDLAPAWASTLRDGRTPWCEVTVYLDEEGGSVGSFRGEVWPGAWPELFDCRPAQRDGAPVFLTDLGTSYVRAAIFGSER